MGLPPREPFGGALYKSDRGLCLFVRLAEFSFVTHLVTVRTQLRVKRLESRHGEEDVVTFLQEFRLELGFITEFDFHDLQLQISLKDLVVGRGGGWDGSLLHHVLF